MVFNIFLNLTTALSLSCLNNPLGCSNESELYFYIKLLNSVHSLKVKEQLLEIYLRLENNISFLAGTNVFPPPIIEHGPQNQTLMLNDMAMLPCRVIARITPEITWLHDGKPIDFNEPSSRFELLSTGALRITRLK